MTDLQRQRHLTPGPRRPGPGDFLYAWLLAAVLTIAVVAGLLWLVWGGK